MFLALLKQCHQALAHSDLWQICYNKRQISWFSWFPSSNTFSAIFGVSKVPLMGISVLVDG